MKQQSNFQEIIANQEKILEKHSSSIQFSDSVKKYPIVINTPSGEEKVIYVSYDGRILDIVENDVIRIIKGDLIELVVGNRIQRTIGKSINVSDDYNVLSGSQVHLNPSEFRNYYNLDKIESDLLSEESESEECCSCKQSNSKCHSQSSEKVLIKLLVTVAILQLFLLLVHLIRL